jgi:hypothetical protein
LDRALETRGEARGRFTSRLWRKINSRTSRGRDSSRDEGGDGDDKAICIYCSRFAFVMGQSCICSESEIDGPLNRWTGDVPAIAAQRKSR